ncbi:hypothetical protein PsorP6_012061 [Peronosclerospora sorghi]|uniref:Uncharacterized protein n=1 Tax=Peronosclerospora sorghi TaxID=230839 RepID=A0ACC0WJR2_9STRA|nr:hypothetical protein PsorP6_012061 [Peronosclerospora sorghi]
MRETLSQLAWHVSRLPPEKVDAFISRLWLETQHVNRSTVRGIVLPLFDDIALLGLSLLLELRRLHVTLPVEIPHCGDLSGTFQRTVQEHDENVRFYDICDRAASARMDARPLFCVDLAHCHAKFRSFEIKVLALVYSQFQEIMMLDGDTLFFQSPMSLWNTSKYKNTGTLFFHDRISFEFSYLAQRTVVDGQVQSGVGALHRFLAEFDVSPYRRFTSEGDRAFEPHVPRRFVGIDLGFQPSAILLESHVWKLRSGHQMDSSLLLWNKARQPRATTILASLISLNGLPTAPSYGDKELYWIACELAETTYAFSDFGVGAIGWNVVTSGHQSDGVLCGDALQYYPEELRPSPAREAGIEPLYANSDHILAWGRDRRRLYRTVARPAELYPGSFTERKLQQTCPFDVTTIELNASESMTVTKRQRYYDLGESWIKEWSGRALRTCSLKS